MTHEKSNATKHAPTLSADLNTEIGQSNLVLRVTPMVSDRNINNHVFGGWLMGQTDIAGSILAFKAGTAAATMTTVAVQNLTFVSPVFVGDLVTFYAKVNKIGNTSITVDISGYAWSSQSMSEDSHLVVTATIIYVALDANGKPTAVAK